MPTDRLAARSLSCTVLSQEDNSWRTAHQAVRLLSIHSWDLRAASQLPGQLVEGQQRGRPNGSIQTGSPAAHNRPRLHMMRISSGRRESSLPSTHMKVISLTPALWLLLVARQSAAGQLARTGTPTGPARWASPAGPLVHPSFPLALPPLLMLSLYTELNCL